MLARRQPLAHLSRHRDVVTSLALSFADDHLENERVALGSAPDLDHVDLLCGATRVKGAPHPISMANGKHILCWPGLLRVGTVRHHNADRHAAIPRLRISLLRRHPPLLQSGCYGT